MSGILIRFVQTVNRLNIKDGYGISVDVFETIMADILSQLPAAAEALDIKLERQLGDQYVNSPPAADC